jgi:hypothetical protein
VGVGPAVPDRGREKDKAWGNETIRWNPDAGWLEIKLPGPLALLANQPHGRYRLSCPVGFCYRGDEVAAQAATGAIRYDISHDPVRGRWYIDASWKVAPAPAPSLDQLRAAPVLAADLNNGHLAAWALTPDGNPAGPPVTIPVDLAGQGREHYGNRPARGRRGRGFRRLVAGIPTGKFRERLTQMAANAGISVIAIDPAYTSRWGREYWLTPLQNQSYPVPASGHHAAAVVIGRRALGHRARRRAGVTGGDQRISRRGTAPRAPMARQTTRNGRPREARRQPPP